MTRGELARDKLRLWKLIDRAKKVNFPIPDHWLKYGYPPTDINEYLNIIIDVTTDIFDKDNVLYNYLRKQK